MLCLSSTSPDSMSYEYRTNSLRISSIFLVFRFCECPLTTRTRLAVKGQGDAYPKVAGQTCFSRQGADCYS